MPDEVLDHVERVLDLRADAVLKLFGLLGSRVANSAATTQTTVPRGQPAAEYEQARQLLGQYRQIAVLTVTAIGVHPVPTRVNSLRREDRISSRHAIVQCTRSHDFAQPWADRRQQLYRRGDPRHHVPREGLPDSNWGAHTSAWAFRSARNRASGASRLAGRLATALR